MSKSLQDQLLSLGLAQKRPDTRKKHPGPPKNRRTSPGGSRKGGASSGVRQAGQKKSPDAAEINLAQAYALRKKEEKRQADTARREKREEERRRRELNKQIGVLVKSHRLNDAKADISRNFMYKGRIRKIHLTANQMKALNSGELGIVYMSGGYHLLPNEHVEAVRRLSADHVPDLGGESGDDGEHPVPDDLVW
jgi:uncharacterized protein YaiL (DUF2058 family)